MLIRTKCCTKLVSYAVLRELIQKPAILVQRGRRPVNIPTSYFGYGMYRGTHRGGHLLVIIVIMVKFCTKLGSYTV